MHVSIGKDRHALDVSDSELAEIHAIVTRLTTRKLRERKKDDVEQWLERAARTLMHHSVSMLCALLVFMLLSWFGGKDAMRDAALVFGILISGLLLAACFVLIRGAVPFFVRIRKNPYTPMLWSIEASLAADRVEIDRLLRCRREAIALYLIQYLHEKESFERRGGMIAGALDKVGFFPAVATFIGVATSLWAHSETFVRILVFVVPAFYLMNIASWTLIQEMNRTIVVLQHCIEVHDARATTV